MSSKKKCHKFILMADGGDTLYRLEKCVFYLESYVTNFYLLSTSLKLSSYQLAVGARVLQSNRVTTVARGCSFVPRPSCEGGVLGCNAGWGLVTCRELTSSSTFAASQDTVPAKILALGRI